MLISEKILSLRKARGMSQEDLAELLGVSRQSVSKWESAAAVPDVSKIIELSDVFGTTTDYLIKDSITNLEYSDSEEAVKKISIETANVYIAEKVRNGRWTGLGVMLCITSSIPLFLFNAAGEVGRMRESLAQGFGVTSLLLFIAAAVAIFIINGWRMEPYKYIERRECELDYGVEGILSARKNAFARTKAYVTAVGVALCILAIVPTLFFADALEIGAPMIEIGVTCFMVLIIAVAVFLFITSSQTMDGYNRLLQFGEFAPENANKRRRSKKIASIYWCSVTAIFLAWGFTTFDWHETWVIWPVAGVLYGGIHMVLDLGVSSDE